MTIAAGSAALASDELNVHNADGTIKNLVVTTGSIAAGAVTEAKQTLADNTTGDVSITAHGYAPKAPNDTTKFLRGDATWGTAGSIVQVVNTQTGEVATGTTAIPLDDTIPQITEGNQYMSLAITPTNANNKLKIDVVWIGSNSNATVRLAVALFQDTAANALACAFGWQTTVGEGRTITFTHYMTAGTTNLTTFKIRAGADTGATTTFNGDSGARRYGGILASSITITEIRV